MDQAACEWFLLGSTHLRPTPHFVPSEPRATLRTRQPLTGESTSIRGATKRNGEMAVTCAIRFPFPTASIPTFVPSFSARFENSGGAASSRPRASRARRARPATPTPSRPPNQLQQAIHADLGTLNHASPGIFEQHDAITHILFILNHTSWTHRVRVSQKRTITGSKHPFHLPTCTRGRVSFTRNLAHAANKELHACPCPSGRRAPRAARPGLAPLREQHAAPGLPPPQRPRLRRRPPPPRRRRPPPARRLGRRPRP